ncbi:glycine zipper domain-containing protein [Desulfobacca acetoxidans]|uniref:Uncharacterized protein n=1 Tax=Desulfobacca acetoxidans (strain ATCC 700848 / DSM 11109 / ASRB2) TaxID=880072 RepID=F2NDS9_DESAR|nr:glycine zipper domain-containing protein [Desulfobacca acetoxidans]AEB10426.1 hypothetical protein Desac_2609 [Desulfobacca acetoxidans DSM 11109]HAY21143.1 hypothetical protein [Desulfobacterales bacterium]
MKRQLLIYTLVVLFVITGAGCATNGHYDPARSTGAGALGGAAVGSALGSIIGAATGSAGTGAWVGAATGAIVGGVGGFLYAKHKESQTRDAQMAAETYNYSPGRGDIVSIENVELKPSRVKAGDTINLSATYTLLSGSGQPNNVTLIREVQSGSQRVLNPDQVRLTKPNGTFVDQVSLAIPKEFPRGDYSVVTKVLTDRAMDERASSFTVE